MYSLLLTLAGLSLTGLIMLARAARSAPEGFQDEKGFHALNPDELAAAMPSQSPFSLDDLLRLDAQMASQPWR